MSQGGDTRNAFWVKDEQGGVESQAASQVKSRINKSSQINPPLRATFFACRQPPAPTLTPAVSIRAINWRQEGSRPVDPTSTATGDTITHYSLKNFGVAFYFSLLLSTDGNFQNENSFANY